MTVSKFALDGEAGMVSYRERFNARSRSRVWGRQRV